MVSYNSGMNVATAQNKMACSLKVSQLCRRLRQLYGPVELAEPAPVLDELIATILSQNTSDQNSGAAFDRLLRRFADWDAVRRAPLGKIIQAIRSAGLARRKAPRIKAILQQIHQQHGTLSLDFLRRLPAAKALAYLRGFAGVGPKTAACVLLFACRKPVLPVDTHVHRLSRRLGLIGSRTSADKAHDELAHLVPRRLVLEFHIQLIRHGRTICRARQPRCLECPLLDGCPAGKKKHQAATII